MSLSDSTNSHFIRRVRWYLSHPSYYGEFLRQSILTGKDYFFRRKIENEIKEAQIWCESQKKKKEEIFSEMGLILGTNFLLWLSMSKEYPQIIANSFDSIKKSGKQMGGGSSIDLLYSLAQGISAERIIETGVAYGWSSLAFLLSLDKRSTGRLWSIDKPYPGSGSEKFVGCVVPQENRKRWSLLRGTDRLLLPESLREAGTIDLCHYDSDKSYPGRMWAYPLLWKHLRHGGIFISDDVGDNLAFKNFCHQIGHNPWIIQEGEQRFLGILIKDCNQF